MLKYFEAERFASFHKAGTDSRDFFRIELINIFFDQKEGSEQNHHPIAFLLSHDPIAFLSRVHIAASIWERGKDHN